MLLNPYRFGGGGGGSGHRYWRFLFTVPGSPGELIFAECDFRLSIGGADIVSRPASSGANADSWFQSPSLNFGPLKAISGSTGDYWYRIGAGTDVGWWSFDFGTPQDIKEYWMQATAGNLTYQPSSWKFQWSDDNSSWTTVDTRSGITFTSLQVRTFNGW